MPISVLNMRSMRSMFFALILAASTISLHAGAASASLPMAQLNVGMHLIHAEVADTPESRQQGLMYRKSLRQNAGMLFIFNEKAGHCFWMKNTPLPLSIAFLSDDGTIVNIADMQPHSESNHCPKVAVRYALEMQQGWFAQRGVTAGAKIDGLPRLR